MKLYNRTNINEILRSEGFSLVGGCIIYDTSDSGKISSDEIEFIIRWSKLIKSSGDRLKRHEDDFKRYLADLGVNRIGRFCAWQAWRSHASLDQSLSDYAAKRSIREWLDSKNPEALKEMDLLKGGEYKLLELGIRFPWQAEKFCNLYLELCVSGRSWYSSLQPDRLRVKQLALIPNYEKLPKWVKEVLSRQGCNCELDSGRIGNIWRLIDCAKAWKTDLRLPKRIAEKVGKFSPRMRHLASIAWYCVGWQSDNIFWSELQRLSTLSLVELYPFCPTKDSFLKIANFTLGLPSGFLERKIPKNGIYTHAGVYKTFSENPVLIIEHYSIQLLCQEIFGVAGKKIRKQLASTKLVNCNWASAIAYGDNDAIQKILELKEIVPFQNEAIQFVMSLPMKSRIRLLGQTKFKYHGETYDVTKDYVKDTGFLWSVIKEKPKLGRIRCWFSLHEQVSKAYVDQLPDAPLFVNPEWERVNGLCAIDKSWEIQIPQRINELKRIGRVLKNCVGGYGTLINHYNKVVFAVLEKGAITHCACVDAHSGQVEQFYGGNHNTPADPFLERSVCLALKQAQLIN